MLTELHLLNFKHRYSHAGAHSLIHKLNCHFDERRNLKASKDFSLRRNDNLKKIYTNTIKYLNIYV
jgi:hypothetical protein